MQSCVKLTEENQSSRLLNWDNEELGTILNSWRNSGVPRRWIYGSLMHQEDWKMEATSAQIWPRQVKRWQCHLWVNSLIGVVPDLPIWSRGGVTIYSATSLQAALLEGLSTLGSCALLPTQRYSRNKGVTVESAVPLKLWTERTRCD